MNIAKMKKVIIFVLLGTIFIACSTQKKVVSETSVPTPTKIEKVDSINVSQKEEPVVKEIPMVDTITTKPVVSWPIAKDTIVTPVAIKEKPINTTQNGKQSIYGHVNMRAVISAMPEYTNALQQMDSLQKYLANQYEMMVQEFQKKETEYAADTTSLPMVQQMRQQELQSLVDRIKYFQQTSQQQLELEENRLMVPIYDKMRIIIKQVSDELHLLAVFDDSYLLYSSADATDITNEVIKKLK
ncbi:MAG: OmpH family outer membrane protein [Paludibacteraceae bacterium]|nr:OmpH family outer membrane protein [Paludibacteraceae bacterium]